MTMLPIDTAPRRFWSTAYSGYYLRAADGRRTRVYTTLEAAGRALDRGELFTNAEYEAGAFWPTPGNPTPGHETFAERAANAEAERKRRYHEAKRRAA